MNKNQSEQTQQIWTPTIIILITIMLALLLVTAYYGYITGVLWVLSLGIIYGMITATVYYFNAKSKQKIGLHYVVQTVAVFAILITFVSLQSVFGPNTLMLDYIVLGFSMLFAAGT
ncbi:MAG: hypothetical protein ACFFD8_10225, partial [Candidatus Thorarchaeota archaeon]